MFGGSLLKKSRCGSVGATLKSCPKVGHTVLVPLPKNRKIYIWKPGLLLTIDIQGQGLPFEARQCDHARFGRFWSQKIMFFHRAYPTHQVLELRTRRTMFDNKN